MDVYVYDMVFVLYNLFGFYRCKIWVTRGFQLTSILPLHSFSDKVTLIFGVTE